MSWGNMLNRRQDLAFPKWFTETGLPPIERLSWDIFEDEFEKGIDAPSKRPFKVRFHYVDRGIVNSIYTSPDVYDYANLRYCLREKFNFMILFLSEKKFCVSLFKNGKLKHGMKLIRGDTSVLTGAEDKRRYTNHDLTSELQKFMEEHVKLVTLCDYITYLRLSPHSFKLFYEDISVAKRNMFSQCGGEVIQYKINRHWLRMLELIGETGPQMEEHEEEEDEDVTVVLDRVTRQEQLTEKQLWPSVNAGLKTKLLEALKGNDTRSIEMIYDKETNKKEIVDYLSGNHAGLGGMSYLHYASQNKMPQMVQLLVDLGCAQSTHDVSGKKPIDYCKGDAEMKLILDSQKGSQNDSKSTKPMKHVPKPKRSGGRKAIGIKRDMADQYYADDDDEDY